MSGDKDVELARELAALGCGGLHKVRNYRDVAPALSASPHEARAQLLVNQGHHVGMQDGQAAVEGDQSSVMMASKRGEIGIGHLPVP